ncbi:MAG TPA: UvrD-helicase domain-containing protein [Gemmatimonadales bacterium]|jgi:DNA polymerase III epsilon subunit family exonuclease|nr:UvrD-helicase domain-containing protein [Gemmatimonadales bacterium]
MDITPLPRQREAIEAPLGPVLVVAGPGAGKTFCLISRIEFLIATQGIDPARICVVTFTNKAAEEIAGRLAHALGDRAEELTRGTLHALCLHLLREHADLIGLTRGFGVADEPYQLAILARLKVYAKERTSLLNRFSRRRMQSFKLSAKDEQTFRDYGDYLLKKNLVDFDDIIVRTDDLLRNHPVAADEISARWDYLLVDEFQDLSPRQYAILKRVAPHRNFFAVGDEDQSIFSWTGADPKMLDSFRRDYGVTPIMLDRNCRSSRQIFDVARRLVEENPQLFQKQLSAERESPHVVRALGFADEESESSWLVSDLKEDLAGNHGGWGDYALLYRKHQVGDLLESHLLRAGIPCRMARGRSLNEDEVIGPIIGALRVVRDPSDQVALIALARSVLPVDLFQEVDGAAKASNFLDAVRALARNRPHKDPEGRKLWRLIYQCENLAALARSQQTLGGLIDELLSERLGPYTNILEDRHDDLSDPADLPEAVRLAEGLGRVLAGTGEIVIEPMNGLGIALRSMLIASGLRRVATPEAGRHSGPADLHIGPEAAGSLGLALTVFKALQLAHAGDVKDPMRRFVAFDTETTGRDPTTNEVVDIAAVRVVDGKIVDEFKTLVRPEHGIPSAVSKIHGYDDAMVADAPSFAEVWPKFKAFAGSDLLVAHNGMEFDVPILRRLAGAGETSEMMFFDTLPLARSLFQESAKLTDLAARFKVDAGDSHHAIDDARALAYVYQELSRLRARRARKAVLVDLLGHLALALALEPAARASGEGKMLFEIGRSRALGRYSDALESYEADHERSGEGPAVDEVVRELGGAARMARLQAEYDPELSQPRAVARLRALMGDDAALPITEGIVHLLERVALSSRDGAAADPHRVTLLTLHSTKGLEFSRVYVVGVEDFQIPGYRAMQDQLEDEIQEGRRLLYVGMTRAKDRLILTRADQRFGKPSGGNQFLDEMGLVPET